MTKDEALRMALEALEFDGFMPEDLTHRSLHAKAITAIKQARSAPVQEPVSMRMPKVGDKVVCIEDESLGTVVYLTAGGSPEIKFDDGSHGTYMLSEFAELFGYTTPPAQEFVCSTGLCHYKATSDERLMETLKQEPDAYGYAKRLAEAIWKKHYQFTAPQWEPLDDLMGVLTQIDNMTAGLTTLPAAQRTWTGLTDEEWQDLSDRYGMILFGKFKNEIETKLREKNTP